MPFSLSVFVSYSFGNKSGGTDMSKKYRILSLDGGGIRGLLTAIIRLL